jgi:hypothetical protein
MSCLSLTSIPFGANAAPPPPMYQDEPPLGHKSSAGHKGSGSSLYRIFSSQRGVEKRLIRVFNKYFM